MSNYIVCIVLEGSFVFRELSFCSLMGVKKERGLRGWNEAGRTRKEASPRGKSQ